MDIPLPLYYRIQQKLIKRVEDSEFSPNEKNPSERELMDQYGVSHTTIRKAVKLTSCSEDIIKRGYKPSADVLNLERIKPTRKIAAHLNLKEGEGVILLERIRYAGDQPINHTRSYLPYQYFSPFLNRILGKSHCIIFCRTITGLNSARRSGRLMLPWLMKYTPDY